MYGVCAVKACRVGDSVFVHMHGTLDLAIGEV